MLKLILIGVGSLIVLNTVFTVLGKRRTLKTTMRTFGKVVGYQEEWFKDAKINCPIVSFKTENREIEIISPNGSSLKAYEIGQELEVYYNPQQPENAGFIADTGWNWSDGLLILGGIASVYIGLIYF